MSDAFTQTRLGNSVIFPGGTLVQADGSNQVQPNTRLLIEVNLAELSRHLSPQELGASGPWVFLVETTVEDTDWPPFPPLPTGVVRVCPLKLRFTLGSGGAVHQLECDAHPHAAIQIPTATCRVELFWDPLPPILLPGAPPPPLPLVYQIPNQVRVQATIQRANVVPTAHRSMLLTLDQTAGFTWVWGRVPRFARDFQVLCFDTSIAGVPQGGNLFLAGWPPVGTSFDFFTSDAAAATFLATWSGPQLLTALTNGVRLPIPAMADNWELGYRGPVLNVIVLDFGVGF